jgi:uncharacterized protein with FMN-binding domain
MKGLELLNSKRMIFIVLAVILVFGIARGGKYFYDLTNYRKAIDSLVIGEVDLTRVPDGVYTGSTETVWVAATVTVTVGDQAITDIQLDHRHDRGEAAEIIVSHVIEAQSLQVDIISGATSSSKVILKAIENALKEVGSQ